MFKVTFEHAGGATSIYWIDGPSAADAEATARRQAGTSIDADTPATVEDAGLLPAASDLWPRPRLVSGVRVFTFHDSGDAYDQTQIRDDIHDGDVLHIPNEQVAGFLQRARPVAVSPDTGAFHPLADTDNLVIGGVDYTASAQVARSLLPPAELPAAGEQPRVNGGLQYAAGVWTVTIAGFERREGSGPYTYVVNASDATIAADIAQRHHQTSLNDTDTIVRKVESGAPTAAFPTPYEDLRGIPSMTVVLTPANIRGIARIRLAYKRLGRHIETLAGGPGDLVEGLDGAADRPPTEQDTEVLHTMTIRIIRLVRGFINDLERGL